MKTCVNTFQLKELSDIFVKTNLFLKHDDSPGLSIEVKTFLKLMVQGFEKDSDECWCIPLPFKENRQLL